MIAGIPVPSLITTILMGLANGDIMERWYSWLDKQIKDPDTSTTSFCTYNKLEPVEIYVELYDKLFTHFIHQPLMRFQNCVVYDVSIDSLEDTIFHARYHVNYSNPRLHWGV